MGEKKPKLSITGAIVILSICILLSAFIISSAIRDSSVNYVNNGNAEDELYRLNENFEELIRIIQANN